MRLFKKLSLMLVMLAVVLCPSLGAAQNSFYTDRAVGVSQFNGFSGLVPLSYAQVRICGYPSPNSPCSNPTANLRDLNNNILTVPAGGFGQVTTDVVGRFNFQAPPGPYVIQVAATGSNTPQLNYVVTVGVSGLASMTFTGTTIFLGPVTFALGVTFNGTPGSVTLNYLNTISTFQVLADYSITSAPASNVSNFISKLVASAGGTFSTIAQTPFFEFNADGVMKTKGQLVPFWAYNKGLGVGNVTSFSGINECWGGSSAGAGNAEPQCTAFGEFDMYQGATSATGSIFRATVNGSPGSSATVLPYTTTANESVLGQRYVLFTGHATTTGTVNGIANNQLTFAGGPFWDAAGAVCNNTGVGVHCNPIGQYVKLSSTTDLYAPACSGDDVTIDNLCIGHWYKITGVISSTVLQIEVGFDSNNLSTAGTPVYMLQWGNEIQSFDTTAKTITIAANSYSLNNGDTIYSPPSPFMDFLGGYALMNKRFKLNGSGAPSAGWYVSNGGAGLLEDFFEGVGGGAVGGARRGIWIHNCTNCIVGVDINTQTFKDAAIKLSPADKIRWTGDVTGYSGISGTVLSTGLTLYGVTTTALGLKHNTSSSGETADPAEFRVYNFMSSNASNTEYFGIVGQNTYIQIGAFAQGTGVLRPVYYEGAQHNFDISGTDTFLFTSNTMRTLSSSTIGFVPGADVSVGNDIAFSRCSAGFLCIGTGAQGNSAGAVKLGTLFTDTNCSSTAGPAVCGSAAAGQSTVAAAATTKVVNTTSVGANSEIIISRDDSLGTRLSVTCNTQSSLVLGTPRVTARVAGTSFTVTLDVAPTTNPMCFSYQIVN